MGKSCMRMAGVCLSMRFDKKNLLQLVALPEENMRPLLKIAIIDKVVCPTALPIPIEPLLKMCCSRLRL